MSVFPICYPALVHRAWQTCEEKKICQTEPAAEISEKPVIKAKTTRNFSTTDFTANQVGRSVYAASTHKYKALQAFSAAFCNGH
jgi:hypothetical protein